MLQKLSMDRIESEVAKYKSNYSYYLAVKFCDQYWEYIYKCVRRDLKLSVEYFSDIEEGFGNNEIQQSFDKFQYRNKLYSLIEDSTDFDSEHYESLRKCLNAKELSVLKLFADGYTHIEVGRILEITPENSRQILKRLRVKTIKVLDRNIAAKRKDDELRRKN
jgi:DNA-binding CsgD family transcriptional regulator